MNDVILPITIFFTVYNHREKIHVLFLNILVKLGPVAERDPKPDLLSTMEHENILVKKGFEILVYQVDCPWPHQVRAVFAIL